MIFLIFCTFRFFSPLKSKSNFLLDIINCQQPKHIFKVSCWIEKIGRKRLLYEIRSLVFLSENLTSGKKNLTSGSDHFLMTYKVNGTLFLKNFQDFRVFYREIYFAIYVYRDIEKHMSMIIINHICTKMFH